jgi:hypothetical protein
MLEIELDPLEKNKEGSLRVRKAPAWRYGFLITTVLLWLASLPIILDSTASLFFASLTAMGVLAAISLIIWYVFSNKVSGFHSAGLSQIALSRGTKYQYSIEEGLIQKRSEEGCKSWAPSQFERSEVGHGYAIVIFRTAVCYLPFRGAGRQQVIDFVHEVEQLARNK